MILIAICLFADRQFIVNLYERKWHYGGATIEYSGVNKSAKNGFERINSTRPIDRALRIEVLCVGNLQVPRIEYRYVLATKTRYEWYWDEGIGRWTECSKPCFGKRQQKFLCTAVTTNRGSNFPNRVTLPEEYCRNLSPPPIIVEMCNTHCEFAWNTEPRDCSVKCGQGYRSFLVNCVQRLIGHNGKIERQDSIDDQYCKENGPKPKPVPELCIGTDCHMVAQWRYTNKWSPCILAHNKVCGNGTQTRVVECVAIESVVSPDECKLFHGESQQHVQTCNLPCPKWVASIWTEVCDNCIIIIFLYHTIIIDSVCRFVWSGRNETYSYLFEWKSTGSRGAMSARQREQKAKRTIHLQATRMSTFIQNDFPYDRRNTRLQFDE